MTMRIGVDARLLNVSHIRGTGRYIYELLRHTEAADGVEWTVYGHDPSRPVHVPPGLHGSVEVFGMRGHRFNLWEQIALPWRVRGKLDVLHCADNTAPLLQPMPTVVTIHDTLIWTETTPGTLAHHYLHDVQRLALRRCAAVVTISEASRRDIAARWPFVADRLTVIPHGIADDYFEGATVPLPEALRSRLGDAAYLIYLGGPHPRKRFGWALDLLARCGRTDLQLLACGFAAGTAPLHAIPAALKERVHFAGYLSEAELVAAYKGACAAVYPTVYEGFGFPAIEAQAAGTPVIFSPVTSLVDLVGPLAWAVDVNDADAWDRALAEILAMPAPARAARADAAMAWARNFSWRTSVRAHFDLFRRISGVRPG